MTPVLIGVFGLIVGSFLNVVIHRVPMRQSVVGPGSHCPDCQEKIRAQDNVPLLSYVLLGGRCRTARSVSRSAIRWWRERPASCLPRRLSDSKASDSLRRSC